ncbi:hypothetical protein [Pediococcus stilesii]|uniref:Uncharacterized protein n=1 Tax=Pediococcus stilesii TaxID=331679 RepID=A0A0R2L4U4_9LACO|nr:hypothetical protein [Pediococcus stilesii]KRN94933.1 hypothetical protein IV81_GL000719 [Pediococcus stilesii]
MIHVIGVILTMLYGGILIYSARRIEVQVETWIMVLNIIVGVLMLLTFIQPWLGIIGIVLALPVTLINGQFIFYNINWSRFVIRTIVTIIFVVLLLV